MESFSKTHFGTSGQVTFHNVISTYPSVTFYFSFPPQFKPESGDWIAIYPVGWSNFGGDYLVKKMVKPDGLWNETTHNGDVKLLGSMEFAMSDWIQIPSVNKLAKEQQNQFYQLVYLRWGEFPFGMSKPFSLYGGSSMVGGGDFPVYNKTTGIATTTTYPIDRVESGLYNMSITSPYAPTKTSYGTEFFVKPEVEKLVQQLIDGVYSIDMSIGGGDFINNGLAFAGGVDGYFKSSFGELYGKFSNSPAQMTLINQVVMPGQLQEYWKTRMGEIEHMLTEQFKIEQAQRRIDQTHVLAQLKTYERYIYYLMKNEYAINEYMKSAKVAAKLAEFEQKCFEVAKTHSLVEQPEYYIQKYKQMLTEKIELEIVERAKCLPKLLKLVQECLESKLSEIQQAEYTYFTSFYNLIKSKLGLWESKYYHPIVGQFVGSKFGSSSPSFVYEEKLDYELRQQFKYLISQFYTEQVKEQYELVKLSKKLDWMCGEISSKLYQFEWAYGVEMYSQVKSAAAVVAPKLKPFMFISSALYPSYTSLVEAYPITSTITDDETYVKQPEYFDIIKKLVQMKQTLSQVRGTLKCSLFSTSTYQEKFPGYETWSPIELYLQSGCHPVWKHLQMLERKLVFLKGIWLEKQLKSYLKQRMTEYEMMPTIVSKFGDKIKYLKTEFGKHYQLPTYGAFCWPATNHYLFTTPEAFFDHHEQFDNLWTLFNEFEFKTVWGGEQSTIGGFGGSYNGGFGGYGNSPASLNYEGSSFANKGLSLDYPLTKYGPSTTTYGGYKYDTPYYPTSKSKYDYSAYYAKAPLSSFGSLFGSDELWSHKSYKPYLGRSSVGLFAPSYYPITEGKFVGAGSVNPVETVLGELEGELIKMKSMQREFGGSTYMPIPYSNSSYF